MVDPWIAAGMTAEAAITAVAASVILREGLDNPWTWAMGGILGTFVVNLLLAGPAGFLGLPPDQVFRLEVASAAFLVGTYVAFLAVYPHWNPGLVRWGVAAAGVAYASVFTALLFAWPSLLAPAAGRLTDLAFAVFTVPGTLIFFVGVILLGRRWIASDSGDRRRRHLFVLVPFAFWALNDGLGGFLQLTVPGIGVPGPGRGLLGGLLALPVVAVIGLVAAVAVRVATDRRSSDDVELLGWVGLGGLGATFSLLFPELHLLVDGAFVLVLFYGVAKHQVLDIDLKIKVAVNRTTVTTVFFVAFFLVPEAIEWFVEIQAGPYVGLSIAAVVALGLRPVESFATRVAEGALPDVDSSEDYIASRRRSIYRRALEGMLEDGRIDVEESAMLANLREELDVTPDDHTELVDEVREEMDLPPA